MLFGNMLSGVFEAGCDEAGRGPLAGSVFAAAVILPENYTNALLNDSKQLTAARRETLREQIEREALAWSVAEVTAREIDQLNILNASILAMQRALDGLQIRPAHILVDGNRWKPYGFPAIPATTVVHGDATYMSIAAASILAKTYRDAYMRRLAEEFPQYGWAHNMGYPTAEHYAAIAKYGVTPYHRKTFRLCKTIQKPEKISNCKPSNHQ